MEKATKTFKAIGLALGVAAALCGARAYSASQKAGESPSFEVASIKRNVSTRNGGGWKMSPGRLSIENQTLRDIIEDSYRVKGFQMRGAPGWLADEKYDILGSADSHTKWTEFQAMVKILLTDRFNLRFHSVAADVTGYALLVGKNGPKFSEYREKPGDDPRNTGETDGMGSITGRKIRLAHLADYIENVIQVPVQDQTNLTGLYEISLNFSPDRKLPTDSDLDAMSLPTALETQLGLKLVSRKTRIELFVIDRIERPSEN